MHWLPCLWSTVLRAADWLVNQLGVHVGKTAL